MECNLVRNHTRDFKIEPAYSASSIWNHKYDFRPKLQNPKFNCHFIIFILKSHNLITYIQELLEKQKLPNLPNNGRFVFHFPAMWLVGLKNPWNLIGCFVLLSHSHWLRKRYDLEQKQCDLGISRTAESQSDYKDNQWFQNETVVNAQQAEEGERAGLGFAGCWGEWRSCVERKEWRKFRPPIKNPWNRPLRTVFLLWNIFFLLIKRYWRFYYANEGSDDVINCSI